MSGVQNKHTNKTSQYWGDIIKWERIYKVLCKHSVWIWIPSVHIKAKHNIHSCNERWRAWVGQRQILRACWHPVQQKQLGQRGTLSQNMSGSCRGRCLMLVSAGTCTSPPTHTCTQKGKARMSPWCLSSSLYPFPPAFCNCQHISNSLQGTFPPLFLVLLLAAGPLRTQWNKDAQVACLCPV